MTNKTRRLLIGILGPFVYLGFWIAMAIGGYVSTLFAAVAVFVSSMIWHNVIKRRIYARHPDPKPSRWDTVDD